MFFYKFFQILFWLPLKIMFPTRVIGRHNLEKGGAIYVCNHQSYFDVLVLGSCLWRNQIFLAKKELFKNPFLKLFLKMIGTLPVDRDKPELSTIKACLKSLEKGRVLTVFPQGTRRDSTDLEGLLKGGAIMFAAKSKKPIIPMWIEKKPKLFRFNTLRIGEPFYTEDLFDKKLSTEGLEKEESKLIKRLKEIQN